MGMLDWILRRRTSIPSPARSPNAALVDYDQGAIKYTEASGQKREVRWEDILEIEIETTDQGPFVDDVFWVFKTNSARFVVPSETAGANLLLKRLQKLPEFDNKAAIESATSTENAVFRVWRRPT